MQGRQRLEKNAVIRLLVVGCVIAAFIGIILFVGIPSLYNTQASDSGQSWIVTQEGLLYYPLSVPEYQLGASQTVDNSTLYKIRFKSRDAQIEGLLRMPQTQKDKHVPGIVLLPGATVTKEAEQGLAKYLCSLGYASITFDQRNLGAIDTQGDLLKFLKGQEPVEHKMVYDALAAAGILRDRPDIDPDRTIYIGESNGARFAITACALDPKARGVIAISTCGYGVDEAVNSGELSDPDMIRFYKSVDPETYFEKIPPRKLVMIHSRNDTIIPYDNALQTYANAFEPKDLHTVGCPQHGYCTQMAAILEKELGQMVL